MPHIKTDLDKYMGLFGKILTSRATGEKIRAEKQSNATALRTKSDNVKIYQLKIDATNKLRIPS